MTFKEKLEIERPECVSKFCTHPRMECPDYYGYETKEESESNCIDNGGKGCEYCWNREMKNTGVKAEMKKEFDWDEFKNVNNKIAVHCKTEEELNDFCKQKNKYDGKDCLLSSVFYIYEEQTAISLDGNYCYVDYYKRQGYRILEWSDYMSTEKTKEQETQEFTKADLNDGMVVEQRNEDMYLVLGNKLICEDGFNILEDYDECLMEIEYHNQEYDIMKIFKVNIENVYCLKDILKSDNLELIWERNEVKKMTVEEMRQKLEELTGEKIEIKY